MNEIVLNGALQLHGFENEQQYHEYLRVKQSLRRRVPVGIAS